MNRNVTVPRGRPHPTRTHDRVSIQAADLTEPPDKRHTESGPTHRTAHSGTAQLQCAGIAVSFRVCMLICMRSTSVRIDVATHDELKRLAAEFDTTVGNTVALAVRALRQDHIGHQLQSELRNDETAWLDAELG